MAHLEGLAAADPLFAETLKKPNKNIGDCTNYILNEVKKSGKQGFVDEEVFAMAVHYYDEDDIKPGKAINGTVVVNHSIPAKGNPATPKQPSTPHVPIAKPKSKKPIIENQPSLF